MHKAVLSLVTAATLSAAALDASAMGFGRILSRTVLGQPLNLALTLRLDPGETLDPNCVRAEVLSGEQRIPSDQVRVRLTGGGDERIVRIVTSPAIEEPIVTVTVSAGW
jgi:pilus assembly protein FimV